MEDQLINWKDEAVAVINDVKNHVKDIQISNKLPSNPQQIHLNITTLEDRKLCVRLSSQGFQIIGSSYDEINDENAVPYETPYSLLNAVSVGYIKSFGNNLTDALNKLIQ